MDIKYQDAKERYEQPVILDISPICTVVGEGESKFDTLDEDDEMSNG